LVKKTGSIIVLGGLLLLAASASGMAKTTTPSSMLVQVSGPPPSPMADCSNAGQSGRNYPDAEVEPQLAVHGDNMIAMWHQDRWSNGGGHGIGVGFSSNGGKTWTDTALPVDMCAPGTPASLNFYQRASDPWVSFAPDGTAYASALAFDAVDNKNAVVAATSTDGGATWNALPIPGSVFTKTSQSTDKNATTADPTRRGTAYTVWDTLLLATDNPDDNPHTQAYTGPAYFSKTTDGGQSWSDAKIIINTPQRQQTIGNIIVVDPRNGTLYDFTDLITSPNTPFQGTRSNAQLAFVKSTDGGDTWTQPQIVAPFNSLGVRNPNNTTQSLRVGDGLQEVAIDPGTGKLYVVYESSTNYNKNLNQSRGAWDNEILLTASSDGGASWTGPSVVHALASGLPTYTPTVAVNGGTVAVTYYDNRNLAPGQTTHLPTDYWVSYSTDGGVTFGNEHHIAGPFDQMTAPVARGFFLGDYEGLQPKGNGFQAAFVKTNCNALDAAGQIYPTTGPSADACAAASSNVALTTNTNPTDVFTKTLTP
jgi:hypothetical protein